MNEASLDRLVDSVAWADLSHAYGTALDTPDNLRALYRGNARAREEARRALSLSVIHQGSHWQGAPEATALLVELALAPTIEDRAPLLSLLGYLATRYEGRKWRRSVLEMPSRSDGRAELWRRSYEAIASRASAFVPLLDDADPAVRAHALVLLGYLPSIANESVSRVIAALDDEDLTVGASAALSLAALALQGAADVGATLSARLRACPEESAVGDGCAIGLSWLGDRAPETIARIAAIVARPPGSQPELVWHDDLTLFALEAFDPIDASTPSILVDALFESIEHVRGQGHFTVMDRIEPLLDLVLPEARDAEPLLLEELTPKQHMLLHVLATDRSLAGGNISNALRDRRVPCLVERLAMFLEIGLRDRAHEERCFRLPDGRTERWPLWRFIVALSREPEWLEPGADELARQYSCAELVQCEVELDQAVRYAWQCGASRGYFRRALEKKLDRSPLEIPAIDPPYGTYPPTRTSRLVRDAMLDVWRSQLDHSVVHREALLAALDHAPPRQPWLEALFASRPLEDRESLLLASFARAPSGDITSPTSQVGRPDPVRAPWMYASYAPTEPVARAALALIERVRPWDYSLTDALLLFARLPDGSLDALATTPRSEDLVRRARRVRDGGPSTTHEIERELHAWFRDGVTLSSGQNPYYLAPPCAGCLPVFRALGVDPESLGPGALGGVRYGVDAPRERAFLSAHWQTCGHLEAYDHDRHRHPVVDRAVERARATGATVDPACVELGALARFAEGLERYYDRVHHELRERHT
ncbi:MAG: hypothetical protein JNK05_24740 [Myxococcales bacterium]|nr:hypothetical protein [Myxococcales bacterium]